MENKIDKLLKETLETMSKEEDWQIVERFNSNVQNRYFNRFLSSYLPAIESEFDKRGIDYSQIGDQEGLSFKRKVVLISKVLIPINEN